MKKIVNFLGAIMLLALVSCGNNAANNAEESAAVTDSVKQEVVEQPVAATEEVAETAAVAESSEGMPEVIDFFATWCGPCQKLVPIFEKLEKKYEGKIKFTRVDVDQEPEMAAANEVQAVPTLVFIDKGGNKEVNVGLLSEEALDAKLKALLAK